MKRAFVIFLLVIGILCSLFIYKGKVSQRMQPVLGTIEGKLHKCPDKPNCVNSMSPANDTEHHEPSVSCDINCFSKLKQIAKKQNWKLVSQQSSYMHYTVQSMVFGFTDDIEFLFIEEMLHFRSASRVGHSDMGKNRKRIKKILEILKE